MCGTHRAEVTATALATVRQEDGQADSACHRSDHEPAPVALLVLLSLGEAACWRHATAARNSTALFVSDCDLSSSRQIANMHCQMRQISRARCRLT